MGLALAIFKLPWFSRGAVVAGVRTATVICIGTATLAAFIGAGGLGDPIVKGLALNDTWLILEGAIPAALLAVATELVFEQVTLADTGPSPVQQYPRSREGLIRSV